MMEEEVILYKAKFKYSPEHADELVLEKGEKTIMHNLKWTFLLFPSSKKMSKQKEEAKSSQSIYFQSVTLHSGLREFCLEFLAT